MKYFEKWFFPVFLLLLIGAGTTGMVYYAQNDSLRKDVDTRLADLRQAKAGLDAATADLALAQNELRLPPRTFDELTAVRARINKDQSDIQTYTSEILGDVTYLQGQWSLLTEEEKNFVGSIEKSMSWS